MLSEFERAANYIRYGKAGDYIYNDENGRKIMRKTTHIDMLPECYCFVKRECVGTVSGMSAINWLFGNDAEMTRAIEEI